MKHKETATTGTRRYSILDSKREQEKIEQYVLLVKRSVVIPVYMPRSGDRANRSVRDYDSEQALRRALTAMESSPKGHNDEGTGKAEETSQLDRNNGAAGAATVTDVGDADLLSTTTAAPVTLPAVQQETDRNKKMADLDWVMPSLDPDTSEVQSMKDELQRLLVLKSYMILDSEREATFERLTGLACRIFKVPIALVSVVDLGRQWFMSNRGLGDVRETSRRHAFCAHTIQGKDGAMLVVPDATQDVRFQDNPLVTGPPSIRFYAGAVRRRHRRVPLVNVSSFSRVVP
jgi:hypothetical protein